MVAQIEKAHGVRLIAGTKVGNLIVRMRLPDKKKGAINTRKQVRVECICGIRFSMPEYYLTRPDPKTHCGCMTATFQSTHKLEYNSWYSMHLRCYYKKHPSYMEYGGRGILVCPQWHGKEGFLQFCQDMGPRLKRSLTLDRIRVNEGYQPDNCRWATWEVQNRNKRKFLKPGQKSVIP